MSDTLELGALEVSTNIYTRPADATKDKQYKCIDCNQKVIFRKGTVRRPHFAHHSPTNTCSYYTHPSEAQIHKDAKILIKRLLDNKQQIVMIRKCVKSDGPNCSGGEIEEHVIPKISETSHIIPEYKFNYNGVKYADIAYLDNNEIVCIFEICNTHRTGETNRPEPWYEIDAKDLINSVNMADNIIKINCIRRIPCDDCKLINCHHCSELCSKHIMDTCTNNKWCRNCDIMFWNMIFLNNVPFSDNDTIKSYKGRFDPLYKKWYINRENIHKNIILARWGVWNP